MIRDLTMIGSVLLSVVSLAFGVYKNIEAGNAKAFAYVQAYRVIGVTQKSGVAAALGSLGVPSPVIDFSQSSAAPVVNQTCTDQQRAQCEVLAADVAQANTACLQNKKTGPACTQASQLKDQIVAASCVSCYTQ